MSPNYYFLGSANVVFDSMEHMSDTDEYVETMRAIADAALSRACTASGIHRTVRGVIDGEWIPLFQEQEADELLDIPADSVVGALIVKLLDSTKRAVALMGEQDLAALMEQAAVRQSCVWYFG